jgi:hypothetical protein
MNPVTHIAPNTVVTFQEKDSPIEQVGVKIDNITQHGEERCRILYKGGLHVMSVRADTIKPTLNMPTLWIGLQELAAYYEHSLEIPVGWPDRGVVICKYCNHTFNAHCQDGNQNLYGPFTKVCESEGRYFRH